MWKKKEKSTRANTKNPTRNLFQELDDLLLPRKVGDINEMSADSTIRRATGMAAQGTPSESAVPAGVPTGGTARRATGGASPTVSVVSAGVEDGASPRSTTLSGVDTDTSVDECITCGYCTAVVNDGICCDFCERWFHFDNACSGLDDKYKRMMSHENVLYICNECKKNRPHKNNSIEKQLNLLSEKVNEIAEKIEKVNASEVEKSTGKKDRSGTGRGLC